jgi:pimeloyl-ACP methyl ester carboxylesterase
MTPWDGTRDLAGGKGYVSAGLGQLHYRDTGPHDSGPAFLLMHQSPFFMIEYAAVQTILAARGVRSITVDTPGYGMSDHPWPPPSIEELADNLLALLNALGLKRVIAAGHHTGVCIATALAARHPDRVAGVILHGCPIYTPEEAARYSASAPWEIGTPQADGSHLMHIFRRIPPRDAGETLIRTWMSAALLLQGPDSGHEAVRRYDLAGELARVTAPGMIVTEVDDVTHHMDQRARAIRPDFGYFVLAEHGTSAIMTAPDDWADMAIRFREELGKTKPPPQNE